MTARAFLWRGPCFALALSIALAACGGGGSSGDRAAAPTGGGSTPPARVFADPAPEALTRADVEQTLARAIAEASARRAPAVIAVVDRVGNVLAVYRMTGAPATQAIPRSRNDTARDLQGVAAPATLTAISKAVTGAYLSSAGNAFSTRTASMIVQEFFPASPGTAGLESGPLYGVQFSQLPCSDLVGRFTPGAAPGAGPKRAPLGLAADPGGFPLFKNGVVVGGVGVAADGEYGFDPDVLDTDSSLDEAIAWAAAAGLPAAVSIRADRITVDGALLRYSDIRDMDLLTAPQNAPAFASLPSGTGAIEAVTGYFDSATALAGVAYGVEASGVRPAGSAFGHPDAYVLSDGAGGGRFPIIGGTDAGDVSAPLTAQEVRTVLEEAFGVMAAARAQIRQPLDSRAQVTISVVDSRGRALGVVRSPDAPIFGIDVSLQKARSAAFFSSPQAAADLLAAQRNPAITGGVAPDLVVAGYVDRVRAAFADPAALTGGSAFSDRALGNIARPYFPDGLIGAPPGPLAPPIAEWNPFATGLQSGLIAENVVQHVGFVLGANPDTPARCTFLPTTGGAPRLANGLQIFPGSVPIYRGGQMVGAIGVSGDGIDQDDMVAFLGLARASTRLNGAIGNAPQAIRSDQLTIAGVRLRYVNCPFAPFVQSSAQNVCQGL